MYGLAELIELLGSFMWPFLRIAALWMVIPVFGSSVLPQRIRLLLALATTFVVWPLLPEFPDPQLWSAQWWTLVVEQIALGVLMGFTLQILFEAMLIAASAIGMAMGLGFAQMNDPIRGASSPVLGQLFSFIATLLFLTLDGHLRLFEWLVMSFESRPLTDPGVTGAMFGELVRWSSMMYLYGIQIALPALISLLLMHIGFGVMNRAAPSLHLFAIGFPIAMLVGMIVVALIMPVLRLNFENGLIESFEFIGRILG